MSTPIDFTDGKYFYHGTGSVRPLTGLPDAPPWRTLGATDKDRGAGYQAGEKEIRVVNAALYLRRPILITGNPGIGKSSLAYAVAHELDLGDVLVWPIVSRSTLKQALYEYDAIGRLQEAQLASKDVAGLQDIGKYIRLGPLGTALLGHRRPNQDTVLPRVLLIDEIDKSDIDLPNELLHVFEEGEFIVPELARHPVAWQNVYTWRGAEKVQIQGGHIKANEFPLVILTSNDERTFPPAFLRRCLRLDVDAPGKETLERIVKERFRSLVARQHPGDPAAIEELTQRKDVADAIQSFINSRDLDPKQLATDQLLNVIHLILNSINPIERDALRKILLHRLADS